MLVKDVRVLMLNNEYPPLGGGTATVNQELLQEFVNMKDIQVDLVTAGTQDTLLTEELSPEIHLYRLPVKNACLHHATNRDLIEYYLRALKLSWKLTAQHQYDLIFAWCSVPAGFLALNLSYLRKLPYIVRVSGPDIPGFEERYKSIYPILTPLLKRTWHSASRVIAKCEGESELLQQTSQQITPEIIRNGIRTESFPYRERRDFTSPLKIVCVGRLIERKGQSLLFQALRELLDKDVAATVTLIGTGDAERKYRTMVSELGIENSVHFEGYVPREDLPNRLIHFDLFALPSENEGMSVATLEALAAGLPIISTETGGAKELVDSGMNGYLFPVGDLEQLVRCIDSFVTEPSRLNEFSAASRRKAESLSWSEVAVAYHQLFHEVCNRE